MRLLRACFCSFCGAVTGKSNRFTALSLTLRKTKRRAPRKLLRACFDQPVNPLARHPYCRSECVLGKRKTLGAFSIQVRSVTLLASGGGSELSKTPWNLRSMLRRISVTKSRSHLCCLKSVLSLAATENGSLRHHGRAAILRIRAHNNDGGSSKKKGVAFDSVRRYPLVSASRLSFRNLFCPLSLFSLSSEGSACPCRVLKSAREL